MPDAASVPRRGSFANHGDNFPELRSDAIPECVLEALEAVRAGGRTNMLDRQAVILIASEYADDDDDDSVEEAVDWLAANKDRYIEALKAMGERRVKA